MKTTTVKIQIQRKRDYNNIYVNDKLVVEYNYNTAPRVKA